MRRAKAMPIGELIHAFLREEGIETPLNEHRIIAAWPEVMGEAVKRYTGEIYIKGSTMHIQIKSPALRQNLMMSRTTIAQRLNQHVGAQVIQEVLFF